MPVNAFISVDIGGIVTATGGAASEALFSLAAFTDAQGYAFATVPGGLQLSLPSHVFATLTEDAVVGLFPDSAGLNTGGFNASVIGGGPNTAIVAPGGNLAYGASDAGHIFATGGTGSIFDGASAATIAAIDGAYTVEGLGADLFVLGGAGASVVASSGGASSADLEGGVTYTAGGADTVFANAGTSTVLADGNTLYSGDGTSSVFFVGGASASTVLGGLGSDTVYGSGMTYVAGNGDANVFAGVAAAFGIDAASTIYGGRFGGLYFDPTAGADTIQAGGHGDLIYLGQSADRIVSGGGKDTIWGNNPSDELRPAYVQGAQAPTVFGMTGSDELLVNEMNNGLFIGLGDNTTLDGANIANNALLGDHLNFFANPGYGNQTFIGSAFGTADSFYIGAQDVGTSLITIENWHAGDSLNLTAFGAADQAVASRVFAAGQGLFRLGDGTTVVFSGAHPVAGHGGLYS